MIAVAAALIGVAVAVLAAAVTICVLEIRRRRADNLMAVADAAGVVPGE